MEGKTAYLDPKSPLVLKTIAESHIRKKTGASIVGVLRNGRLRPNPDADFILMPDDLAAVIGNADERDSFCAMASPIPQDAV